MLKLDCCNFSSHWINKIILRANFLEMKKSISLEEKAVEFYSFVIFWTVWKERNRIAFEDGVEAIQRLKYSFVYNLWSWNRVF